MYITQPGFEILDPAPFDRDACLYLYRKIEQAARTCYRSEDLTEEGSAEKMVEMLVRRGHEAMLEHADISVRFTVDRGITHELVRHRLCSFAQESTRYCNYSKGRFGGEIGYISISDQLDWHKLGAEGIDKIMRVWTEACADAEFYYKKMLLAGAPAEIARGVLNHSTASSIVVKANIREWRHIFMERAVGAHGRPHPEIQKVMRSLLKRFAEYMPEVFGGILDSDLLNNIKLAFNQEAAKQHE